MKSAVSVFAFFAAFFFSSYFAFLFVDYPEPHEVTVVSQQGVFDSKLQKKLSRFLQKDINNGNSRLDSSFFSSRFEEGADLMDALPAYADSTEKYVRASESMDYSKFPEDFQDAWKAHMQAWRDRADFLARVKNMSRSERISGDEFWTEYEFQMDEINDTWIEVKIVAWRYGANFRER